MKGLLATNGRLNILLSYIFNADGTINFTGEDNFMSDLFKWVYGPLTTSGSSGHYITVSTPPYSMPYTGDLVGREVFFKANADSPAGGVDLVLDGLPPHAIVDQAGLPIAEGGITFGSIVHVIYDGSNWRVLTELVKPIVYTIPKRVYDGITLTAGTKTDFPKTLSISIAKPSLAQWKSFDLYVTAGVSTHTEGVVLSCAIKWTSGSRSGSSVDSGIGCSNVNQKFVATIQNASAQPTWQASFDCPDADIDVSVHTFEATITLAGLGGVVTPDLAILPDDVPTQNFRGVGYLVQAPP